MDEMTERSRQRSSFNAWYDRNSESYNAERKRRYHQSPEVREKARVQAAEYRRRLAAGDHAPALRHGFYTSASVSELLGISTQTLRNWESRQLIPKPTVPGKHRLYAPYQVALLKSLIEANSRAEFEIARTNLFLGWETANDQH